MHVYTRSGFSPSMTTTKLLGVHILESFSSSNISSLAKSLDPPLFLLQTEPHRSSLSFISCPQEAGFWRSSVVQLCPLPTYTSPPPKKNHDKADILKDQVFVAEFFFSCLFICPPPSLMEHHLLFLRSSMTEQDVQVCQTLAQIHHLLPCNVTNWPLLHEQKFSSRYYLTLLLECAKKHEMLLNMTW